MTFPGPSVSAELEPDSHVAQRLHKNLFQITNQEFILMQRERNAAYPLYLLQSPLPEDLASSLPTA
jgi:hypothetical protein